MGACYTIEMRLMFKDEDEFIRKSNSYIDSTSSSVDYSDMSEIDRNTVKGILSILFTNNVYKSKSMWYSDFNASYGWERVMTDWFTEIADTLRDKSRIKIWPDEDYDDIRVVEGKAVWIH